MSQDSLAAADSAVGRDEFDALIHINGCVAAGAPLPVFDVHVLAYALFDVHLSGSAPALLPLDDMSGYAAVHAINVALLAMELARELRWSERARRELATAALLHDIGMARVPREILVKSEQLSAEDRERIRAHPLDGARLIIEADPTLELAAIVAYEHHINFDGSGYPALRYRRPSHVASRLVQVCDTFHALRTARPFREAWPVNVVLSFLNQRSGNEFDPEFADALGRWIAANADPVPPPAG
jgi:putative nucleotidyltransferase with HDIG domain